jgi:hypothetical protein
MAWVGVMSLLSAAAMACEGGVGGGGLEPLGPGGGGSLGCSDDCAAPGLFSCASPEQNALVVCADFDADGCLEWGGLTTCPADQTCVDGACQATGCSDECVLGASECVGDGVRSCGQHDADPCLEWSDVVGCPEGQSCSQGSCTASCADECEVDATKCDGNGVRSCGQHDSDPCLDWSAVAPCDEGEACQQGVCSKSQCTEEGDPCTCGANECCTGHCCPVFKICVSWEPNEDVCPFGP